MGSLAAAYGIAGLAFVAYIVRLRLRHRLLVQQLKDLEESENALNWPATSRAA